MRRIFTLTSAFSLGLCVLTCIFWLRSYRPVAEIGMSQDSVDLLKGSHDYWISSSEGYLRLCQQTGTAPLATRSDVIIPNVLLISARVGDNSLWNLVVPYWTAVAATLVLPLAWLIVRMVKLARTRSIGFEVQACRTQCSVLREEQVNQENP